MKEAMGAVMPIPELTNEETDRSLIQTKPQPEIRILDNNWLGLEIGGTRNGDMVMKHSQGIAVMTQRCMPVVGPRVRSTTDC